MTRDGKPIADAETARLVADREGSRPRSVAFRFAVADGKIDEETARDFWEEAKRKALELQAQFGQSQFDENFRAHVAQLLQHLGNSYAEAHPGKLISSLRTFQSDVRAFDGEEGRRELGLAHLSQILDVAASFRDLCATFRVLREIEVEAASLNRPPALRPEIRDQLEAGIEMVNHSDGVTKNARAAVNAGTENMTDQRRPQIIEKESGTVVLDRPNVGSFDRLWARIKNNIEIEQKAMDELLTRLRKIAV